MQEIVGIRFKPVTKVYYFDPGEFRNLVENDPVVVETARGEELGWVNIPLRMVSDEEIKGTLKPITRRATPLDLAQMEEHRAREAQALNRCRDKVAELGLPMKVVRAEYSFNGRRLLFAFIYAIRVNDFFAETDRDVGERLACKRFAAIHV